MTPRGLIPLARSFDPTLEVRDLFLGVDNQFRGENSCSTLSVGVGFMQPTLGGVVVSRLGSGIPL